MYDFYFDLVGRPWARLDEAVPLWVRDLIRSLHPDGRNEYNVPDHQMHMNRHV